MDGNSLESKYQKLATEYSKIRAQASVLKKAVIEEQTKNLTLRETLRQKETSLRRAEQEVDSLGFRNKQLEYRVASLQEDLEKESKKSNAKQSKTNKTLNKNNCINSINSNSNDEVRTLNPSASNTFFEELNAKIQENATITSLLHDKEQEIQLYKERCLNLEKQLEKCNSDSTELEKRLRRDLDALQIRNSELETKLVEAASMLGSEDALSASGSDNTTPLHTTTGTSSSSIEERIIYLEKEICHWRTQYEILKINNCIPYDRNMDVQTQVANGPAKIDCLGSCSNDKIDISKEQHEKLECKEQLLIKHFNKKIEEMLRSKCTIESRLSSYQTEIETLQMHIEILMNEIKSKENELRIATKTNQTLEDHLTTTRFNYDEQISVLTEQVISLSEQLASSK
ncbi:protein BCAP [Condylostylus longicornis]|uniref:protein BCAP n=1 Tax=Condylostylus longicornis TaxID=2530218 RepID=UPI00244E4D9C|nr:protein BCAP [Condylostylus longicornis]